jgi:MOSC domain-containing protein YiiM
MDAAVISVSSKETPGIPKLRRDSVTLVANHGVEGDYHAGATVRHRSRAAKDSAQPNLRQVHLMHSELFDEVAEHGITVGPGQMGENITTRGLALLDLPLGTRLHIGATAVVELTGVRNPCTQLDSIDPALQGRVVSRAADGSIVRKAGVMGIVVEGGVVRAGDAITVEAPAEASRLEPV